VLRRLGILVRGPGQASPVGREPLLVGVEVPAQEAGDEQVRLGRGQDAGRVMGYALSHPNGGPPLALRLDPERARAAAGFDYFSIGVPDKDAIDQLAARLTGFGEPHAGVHWASVGWILPELHDPDGHEVRFYTLQHHTELDPDTVTVISDPRESAERRERAAAPQP
jgi:hypothetical protein